MVIVVIVLEEWDCLHTCVQLCFGNPISPSPLKSSKFLAPKLARFSSRQKVIYIYIYIYIFLTLLVFLFVGFAFDVVWLLWQKKECGSSFDFGFSFLKIYWTDTNGRIEWLWWILQFLIKTDQYFLIRLNDDVYTLLIDQILCLALYDSWKKCWKIRVITILWIVKYFNDLKSWGSKKLHWVKRVLLNII